MNMVYMYSYTWVKSHAFCQTIMCVGKKELLKNVKGEHKNWTDIYCDNNEQYLRLILSKYQTNKCTHLTLSEHQGQFKFNIFDNFIYKYGGTCAFGGALPHIR